MERTEREIAGEREPKENETAGITEKNRKKRIISPRTMLALTMVEGMTLRKATMLLEKYGECVVTLFRSRRQDLKTNSELVGFRVARNLADFREWDRVDEVLMKTDRAGASLLTRPEFHDRLRFDGGPLLLWLRGDPEVLKWPGVAVVGTRHPDRYGREQAEKWSRELVQAGVSVISGLAYGIDTIAHRTALEQGGRTIAVLGSGIDWIYPSVNRSLAERIVGEGGAVITPYPPGTSPKPYHFPERNHIVSGLSFAVLVIQTGLKGGSMITARAAVEQNRELFVIPHNLNQKRGAGNLELLRDSVNGGQLVREATEIIGVIFPQMEKVEKGKLNVDEEDLRMAGLTGIRLEICRVLDDGGEHLDRLAEILDKPVQQLLPYLLELELEGVIRQSGGNYYEMN